MKKFDIVISPGSIFLVGLTPAEQHRVVDLFADIEEARESDGPTVHGVLMKDFKSHHHDIGPRPADIHIDGATTGRFPETRLHQTTKVAEPEDGPTQLDQMHEALRGAYHNSTFKPGYIAHGSTKGYDAYAYAGIEWPTLDVDQSFTGEHVVMACTGCGCQKSIGDLRAEHPHCISCCPERDMRPKKFSPSTAPRWACRGQGNDDDNC